MNHLQIHLATPLLMQVSEVLHFLSNFTATCRADIASGQFSDRKTFVRPVMAQVWSLLSVINIDRLFVCLFVT